MNPHERQAGGGDVAAGGGGSTFQRLLRENAAQRGTRPALREKARGIWHTTSWSALADETSALAAGLAAQGLKRGARIALVADNRPRLYAAIGAAHLLGAVPVPLFQDASADELATAIQKVGATHAFAEDQEQVDKLLLIQPRCPSLASIVYDDDRGMRHYRQPGLVSYDALLRQGRELAEGRRELLAAEAAQGSSADPAFVFFTSGTMGPAKGVVLTHGALIENARAAVAAEGLGETDVSMAYLPPGWIGQSLLAYVQPMIAGYCVCCPESSETMLADMREIGPTYFLAPPRVLETLLTQISMRIEDAGAVNRLLFRTCMEAGRRARAPGAKGSATDGLMTTIGEPLIYAPLRDVLGMSRIRVAYATGDAIDPDLVTFFRAIGINLKPLYGLTEAGFFIATPRGTEKAGTVGPPLGGVELSISPESEVLVRSNGRFSEYLGDVGATARAHTPEGWIRTGDAGHIDDDGHLRIIDRLDHVGRLAGGALFAPRVIENRLKVSPYVREAAVFSDGGEGVCALIDIDPVAVSRWADKRSIAYTGSAELAGNDQVYELIAGRIGELNRELAADPALAGAQIRRFALLPHELSADDGALTRTGKLRRAALSERFAPVIAAMHAGRASAPAGADASAELNIREAKVFTPTGAERSI